MRLTEAEFTEKVTAACPCGAATGPGAGFDIRAYVALRQPLLEGEPHGQHAWAYKGEEFVHGVFSIACAACKRAVFEDAACPKCDAEGGLERALEKVSGFEIPEACQSCGGAQVQLYAYVPVRVAYRGVRAEKARTNTRAEEPGYLPYRVECKACLRDVALAKSPCVLCDA